MSGYDHQSAKARGRGDPVVRHLGALQAEVLTICWSHGACTVREIREELSRRRPLAYTTVLTVASRLWSRGLLEREPEGRSFRYRAAKTREELLGDLSDELIDRLFGDFGDVAVARLAAHIDTLDDRRKSRLRGGRSQ